MGWVQSLRTRTQRLAAAAAAAASVGSVQEVATVFREDTGFEPSDVFESIEETPIAAASLAQVHRAMTRDGQRVAVKIQYPELRVQARNDFAALRFFAGVLEAVWPDYGYTWLLPEFETSLANEVNFLQEAHNAERVAGMFADNPRVHVPAIRRDLSTHRVLVMEFIDGFKVSRARERHPARVRAHTRTHVLRTGACGDERGADQQQNSH